jgi:hypothetical protein
MARFVTSIAVLLLLLGGLSACDKLSGKGPELPTDWPIKRIHFPKGYQVRDVTRQQASQKWIVAFDSKFNEVEILDYWRKQFGYQQFVEASDSERQQKNALLLLKSPDGSVHASISYGQAQAKLGNAKAQAKYLLIVEVPKAGL